MIKSETIKLNGIELTRRYEIDSLGRVTSINDPIFGNKTYAYNSKGFLINDNGTTISYGKNGNITSYGSKTFSYDSSIKDRLINVGGVTLAYDGDRSPLYPVEYGTNSFVWEGKQLVRHTYSGGYYEFRYNEEGLRVYKKNHQGQITRYFYDGDKLITEINSTYRLDFLYDEQDLLYGLIYNNDKKYFYVRDMLQNILGIVDEAGNIVVKYSYNAYGIVTIVSDTSGINLAVNNPFRYKGYYSPELCRWISPDSIEYLDPESINGLNLYAYCGNDPVNYYDPSGHTPEWLQGLAIGLAIVGALLVAGAITVLTCGVGTSIMVGTLAGSMLHGAAIGTLIGAGVGVVGGAIVGGALTDWSVEGILTGIGIGFGGLAFLGAIIGATAGGIHYGWQQSVLRKASSFLSYADETTELHHIVEQCQIKKSGFSSKLIRNSNNEVRIAKSLHSRVSSYYSSLYKNTGMRFRNYLTANHYSLGSQYNTGVKVLKMMLKGMI